MLAVSSQAPLCLHSRRYSPYGWRSISSVSTTQTTPHKYATYLNVSDCRLQPYWEPSLRWVALTCARLGASDRLFIRPVPWGVSFSFLIFKSARAGIRNSSSKRPPEWWRRKNGFIVIYLIASAIFMMLCPGKCPPLVLGSLDHQYYLFCVGSHEITAINSQQSDLNTWVSNYQLLTCELAPTSVTSTGKETSVCSPSPLYVILCTIY